MKPLIVTSGDPAGIGPEIVLKAIAQWHASGTGQRPLLIAGDPDWFHAEAKKLLISTENLIFVPNKWDKDLIKTGQVGKESGQAAFESIRSAVAKCTVLS